MNYGLWLRSPVIFNNNLDRRNFLIASGKSLLTASVLGTYFSDPAYPQALQTQIPQKPLKLTALDAPSEKETAPLPTPIEPRKRIGYALVGLGHLTLEELLPAFASCKYSKPVALVSGDPGKAATVAAQYGIDSNHIYNYQNYDEIKNNPAIDVVYIVLPNSMHEEFTIRAARAGKHVLCEKPMATTVSAAERMVEACKTARKKLMVAYRIQYEPHNRKVQEWVRNEKFGKVRLIESVNAQNIGDPGQWRLKKSLSGGGALPDIGIYCLNTIRFLLGEEPEAVTASLYRTSGDPRFREVEEAVLFQLFFPGGAIANCSSSYSVHESRRYRCYADKGGWMGMDPAFSYQGLRQEASKAEGEMEIRQEVFIGDKNQFALEIDHMSQCILNDKRPYTPGEEGLQDLKIIEAIYKSAETGKRTQLETFREKDVFRGDMIQ
jgi:predicted dehydrogenase